MFCNGRSKEMLKVAVIGCGRIGAFTVRNPEDNVSEMFYPINHCEAIRAIEGIQLTAVCDLNFELAEKAAKLHNVENIYSDYKKMIIEQRPDIVSIATRIEGKTKIIAYASEHGVKGLHIEKPLSDNLYDSKEALKSIERNGIAISYGTVRRYTPVFRQAKKLLDSRKFGSINEIIVASPEVQLLWSHPHSIDLLTYFTNNSKVDYIEALFDHQLLATFDDRIDFDPIIKFGLVKFENGIFTIKTNTNESCLKILCEFGEIIIDLNGNYFKTKSNNGEITNVKVEEGPSGRCSAIAELRDYINYKHPTTITAKEILNEQKIILALGLAGIRRNKTKLSDLQDKFTITGRFGNLFP